MRLQLSIEDKSDLHRLQRNLIGTPDHVCVTCILMFDNDTSPKFISANLDISPATIYRYVGEYQAVLNLGLRAATMDIGVCLAAIRQVCCARN